MAIGNSIQSYLTTAYTTQVYASAPSASSAARHSDVQSTPLQSRTFGTWTSLAAIVRIYAAYNITNPILYKLALWSYVIAFAHFISEWLIFGTARWGRGLAGPVVVSTGSLLWMYLKWEAYVR